MKPDEKLRKLAQETKRFVEKNASKFDFLLTDIPNQIKTRTRLGRGVQKTDGKLEPLKKLSDKYVKVRQKNKPDLKETTPKRSALTATGQMLDSIKGIRRGSTFSFFFEGKRSKELGNRIPKLTNDEVAGYVKKDRPFFYLSKPEMNNLIAKVKDEITKSISKLFDA
jgi:hypothetical protein